MGALDIKLAIKCGAQPNQVHRILVTLISRMRQTSLIRILFLLFHWTFGEAGGTPPPYLLGEKRDIWIFHCTLSMPQHSTIMEKSSTGACCSTTSLPLVLKTRFTQKHTGYTNVTGWSKETVKSNLYLTGPEISKSAITQWFLGSLYRAVLVFWCFKSVKCVEFCLSKLFQYRAFASPYKA